MVFANPTSKRFEAQELMWEAMDQIAVDEAAASELCRRALAIYPHCVDALAMLANLECDLVADFVAAMRSAVEAGRKDLGKQFFEEEKGDFWGLIETRPFMRAMAGLADALVEWGTADAIDEAITLQEEMLELNPNDNQGIRDVLAACYLRRKRYDQAGDLFKRYEDDWMAAPCWARVLLTHAAGDESEALSQLKAAREQNPHVELFFTGRKRRPRHGPDFYSPGDITEALFCANTLWEAWKTHPKSKRWLKEVCAVPE